jgi:hypothetical protein
MIYTYDLQANIITNNRSFPLITKLACWRLQIKCKLFFISVCCIALLDKHVLVRSLDRGQRNAFAGSSFQALSYNYAWDTHVVLNKY